MNWYYAQGEQRQGPISDSELDALLAAGTINENTLVWQEGMANWTPLKDARAASGGAAENPPPGWIRCTATGRYFPPEQIVYLDGKPYSAEAKPAVLQGVMQGGILPSGSFERNGPPWEQRAELGFFPATWETIKTVLIQPGETFDRMKREGGLGNPLLFNVIVGSVGGIIGLIYQLLFNSGMQAMIPQAQRGNSAASTGFLIGFTLGMAIAMPVILAITAFISAGITHLSLMICGGAKQSFETTFRTYCYVSGASSLLQVVPICGAYISGIWGLVCMCIGIARTHEIGVGRAVVAVLLPTVVCCVLVVFAVFAVMGAVFASQGIQAPQ